MYILTSKYFPTDYWPDLYFPVLPEGADIQYKEVVEFTLAIATTAEFELVLPNGAAVAGTVTVSGAGTTAANGTYSYAGKLFGKPSYTKGSNSLFWYGAGYDVWGIFVGGLSVYESTDDVATPDLVTTWTAVNSGIAPVPTVTSTNPLSGVQVTVPFTVEMPMVIEIETYEELSA